MFAETKSFLNKFNIDVSSLLMSSLCAIVMWQKYFGNHVISSKIHHFAPLLNMRRCTLCLSKPCFTIHKMLVKKIRVRSFWLIRGNLNINLYDSFSFSCNRPWIYEWTWSFISYFSVTIFVNQFLLKSVISRTCIPILIKLKLPDKTSD